MCCTVGEIKLCYMCRHSIPVEYVEYIRYCYKKETEVVNIEAKDCEDYKSIAEE